MKYILVHGPCVNCGSMMSYNPNSVLTTRVTWVEGKPQPDPRGENEPVCRGCVGVYNDSRVMEGLEPIEIPEGAYDPVPAHEVEEQVMPEIVRPGIKLKVVRRASPMVTIQVSMSYYDGDPADPAVVEAGAKYRAVGEQTMSETNWDAFCKSITGTGKDGYYQNASIIDIDAS